jgi:2-C-methyl-D-erythritol 4-phosphate cytidylyltransferase
VPPEALDRARGIIADVEVAVCTQGGASRQASVAGGLALVDTDSVVVHDAARPFATRADALAVIAALERADGAIVATPVDETLKRVHDDSVIETVKRSSLWRAQTPQAFRTTVLKDAHRRAAEEAFEGTDDAQLLERYGFRVVVVEGSRTNLKLTYPGDFGLAELLARSLT